MDFEVLGDLLDVLPRLVGGDGSLDVFRLGSALTLARGDDSDLERSGQDLIEAVGKLRELLQPLYLSAFRAGYAAGIEDHKIFLNKTMEAGMPGTFGADESTNRSVDTLGLSVRACNVLMREGIHTIGGLLTKPDADLLEIRNLEASHIKVVDNKLLLAGHVRAK